MAGLPCAFARGTVLLLGHNIGIGRPKIREAHAPLVLPGDALPEDAAGGFASIADGVGDDLPRPAALGQPHPALVLALVDERPHLVEFKNVALFGLRQRGLERRQLRGFF